MQMEHRLLLSYQCHCRLKCSIRDACCTHPHSSTFTRTSRMTKNVVQISKTFVCWSFWGRELQKWFQPHFLPRLAYWVSTVNLVLSNQLYSCALMTTFPMTGILNQFESGTRTRRWKNAGGEKVVFGFQQTTV